MGVQFPAYTLLSIELAEKLQKMLGYGKQANLQSEDT